MADKLKNSKDTIAVSIKSLTEMQTALERIAAAASPHLEALARSQSQIEAVMRASLQSTSMKQLSVVMASIDSVQKSMNEALRKNHVIEAIERIRTSVDHSLAAISASAEFQKFDYLMSSVAASINLYTSSAFAVNIQQVASKLIGAFEPAAIAYQNWRTSNELTVFSRDISLATPAREHFLSTDVVDSLYEQSIYEEEAISARDEVVIEAEDQILLSLPSALNAINPNLYRLWRGAWESHISSNPDRARHSLTSLRELVTQVLHAIAPDDEVRAWSSDIVHYHNGRPTRRARFMYVLSFINGEHLKAYLKKEADACLALIDLFQDGTHTVSSAFSDIQLKVVMRKVHSMICTLVEVWRFRG